MGPFGGLFLLAAVAVAGCLLSFVVDGSALCYFFMGACGDYYMTLWTWEAMSRREAPAIWLVLHIRSLPSWSRTT
jgi:hypothetical protein